jgi:hypothetical protein
LANRNLRDYRPVQATPSAAEAFGRRRLLSPLQYKLFWVWGQSLGHPEDAWTEAKIRLCLGTEPGKALSVHEAIGIPEVRVNECINVTMEALDPLSSSGQRESARIVGRRPCRQLCHESRERHSIQHLDLDLETLVQQQPMVCYRPICLWKPQLSEKVAEGRSGQCGGEARGRAGIDRTPRLKRVKGNRPICGNLQTREDDLGCRSSQWGWPTAHSDHQERATTRCARCMAPYGGSMPPGPTASSALSSARVKRLIHRAPLVE